MWYPITGFKQTLRNECGWEFIGNPPPQFLENLGEEGAASEDPKDSGFHFLEVEWNDG